MFESIDLSRRISILINLKQASNEKVQKSLPHELHRFVYSVYYSHRQLTDDLFNKKKINISENRTKNIFPRFNQAKEIKMD